MTLKFSRIPAEGNPPIVAELNAFPAGHKVLRVKHELVEQNGALVGGVLQSLRTLANLIGLAALLTNASSLHAIMAGGEFDQPTDLPSNRLDPVTTTSPFNFVGGLEMTVNSTRFYGSAVALSPHWVLTAGHNVDTNDDGQPDAGLSASFHLPGFGSYTTTSFLTHPSFTGFGKPTIHYDLALLHFTDPLPATLNFPPLGLTMGIGDPFALVGFGRSGFGSYGYTTQAGVENRRIGYNTLESLQTATSGDSTLYRYTFHAPDDPASLGNDLETLIGPGDSGGPALTAWGDAHALVGINTFTEGFGGRFGDIGGGVLLEDYWGWISSTTGLALVPEPQAFALWLAILALVCAGLRSRRRPD